MYTYISEVQDEQASLKAFRCFQDWTRDNINTDIGCFLTSLARMLWESFGAQLVTIWDNNSDAQCLVLQSSVPERISVLASHTLPIEASSTGATVERRDIIFHPDIRQPGEGRHFINSSIVEEFSLASMLSIPVFSPLQPERVNLVINLCFDSQSKNILPIPASDLRRLASDLARSLQYLVDRRDEEIINRIRITAASAKGIPSLFDALSQFLQELTHCTQAALFSLDNHKHDLIVESSIDSYADNSGSSPRKKASEIYKEELSLLISSCVSKSQPLVLRSDKLSAFQDIEQNSTVQCSYMAVPIRSGDQVAGVLRCEEPLKRDKKAPSFSSLDFHALNTFGQAIAPAAERFLGVRQGSGLMRIVKDVSNTMVQAYQLDTSLQRSIETLTSALHSDFGSVYLKENGTDVFGLRAATDPMRDLVGKASYRTGEGITGTIATGQIVNVKTKKELHSHPDRLGKYYSEVWGPDSQEDSETLLGVPIIAGRKVIGVWKVENVHKSERHPDPYYTDEDVQIAQVLSFFLAYAIQNYRQEERRLRQFTLLAQTIQIQQASDEDEAISSVLMALADAGFQGGLLSLYDARTREIVGAESFGSNWRNISENKCDLDGSDLRAIVLRTSEEQFLPASTLDNGSHQIGQGAQYILPLRLDDELIGTLQVNLRKRSEPKDDEKLILRAFTRHLAIAISRMRSVQKSLELTNHIMASSRFITAETLSGMAVHSLHHALEEITNQLKKDLGSREIRQNQILNETLSQWNEKLLKLETDLKKILKFVRAPVTEDRFKAKDLHNQIQTSIDTWINYIRDNKCNVRRRLEAASSKCGITAEGFREIMAVLLINAVQAHAKQIEIKTYNNANLKTPEGKVVKSAFCLDCSDDGIGLSTNDPEEIFDSIYTTKPKNYGTGLGLFVARRLARTAGGDLEVAKNIKQAKGTTFRLTLPIAEESHDRSEKKKN